MNYIFDDDFLLKGDTARELYRGTAKGIPIYEYHCHLSPEEIYNDQHYSDLTDIWLTNDHYKWRLMRAHGISEKFITGSANRKEKFLRWAEVMPFCIGNPLYHWTHIELKNYFGIQEYLSPQTAEMIWEKSLENLKTLSVRKIIEQSNARIIFTTDDPTDSLRFHKNLQEEQEERFQVYPAFHPDKGLYIERPEFQSWIKELSSCVQFEVDSFSSLLKALDERIDYFSDMGCKIGDISLEDPVVYWEGSQNEADKIFRKSLTKEPLSQSEIALYKTSFLLNIMRSCHQKNWGMQLHIGPLRNISDRLKCMIGKDAGADTIYDRSYIKPLTQLLNALDKKGTLPKTILYNLNPRDNAVMAAVIGSFQDGSQKGKIQWGSPWWFNDQKDGMEQHLKLLANNALLPHFTGMVSDSRSFLSLSRHEYFRRILCSVLGTWVEAGEYPDDRPFLSEVVKKICFNNAKDYFST